MFAIFDFSDKNMLSEFFSSGASFWNYSRKTDFDTTLCMQSYALIPIVCILNGKSRYKIMRHYAINALCMKVLFGHEVYIQAVPIGIGISHFYHYSY